jgi:hypothetical protein
MSAAPEKMTEQPPAFFGPWLVFFEVLTHVSPVCYAADPGCDFLSAIRALMSCTLKPGYAL